MDIVQQNTQIVKSQLIRKIRPNLYQLPQGQLVGFGPLESENGTSTCWTCFEPECIHVEAITQAWLDGCSIDAHTFVYSEASQSIPFNGVTPEDDYGIPKGDCEALVIFASSADLWPDDLGLSEATI